jgi:hypothetical protein
MKKICQGYGKPKRGPYPNTKGEMVYFQFKDEIARQRSLMRHPWYRRKIMKEGIGISKRKLTDEEKKDMEFYYKTLEEGQRDFLLTSELRNALCEDVDFEELEQEANNATDE